MEKKIWLLPKCILNHSIVFILIFFCLIMKMDEIHFTLSGIWFYIWYYIKINNENYSFQNILEGKIDGWWDWMWSKQRGPSALFTSFILVAERHHENSPRRKWMKSQWNSITYGRFGKMPQNISKQQWSYSFIVCVDKKHMGQPENDFKWNLSK